VNRSGIWAKYFSVDGARFLPKPVQTHRVPIWVADMLPSKAPFRRAAKWDGVFPLKMPAEGYLAHLPGSPWSPFGSARRRCNRLLLTLTATGSERVHSRSSLPVRRQPWNETRPYSQSLCLVCPPMPFRS
jgi:hypothetical protein